LGVQRGSTPFCPIPIRPIPFPNLNPNPIPNPNPNPRLGKLGLGEMGGHRPTHWIPLNAN